MASIFESEALASSDTLRFLRESSIHGVKYLAQKRRTKFERFCWISVLIVCTGVSGYFIYDILDEFFYSPVIISFQPSQVGIGDVIFPTITACNSNRLKKSPILKFLREFDSNSNKTATFMLRLVDHICSLSNKYSSIFGYSENDTRLNFCKYRATCQKEGVRVSDDIPVPAAFELLQTIQICEYLMPLCIWKGVARKCSDLFRMQVTDMGFCCSFNGIPQSVLYRNASRKYGDLFEGIVTPEEKNFWKKFNFDKLLLNSFSHDDEKREYKKYLRFQSKAGQAAGLSFMLNPAINEYFCDNHDGSGLRIYTNTIVNLAHVADFGVAVGPGSEMFVTVSAELTRADESISDMWPARRGCFYTNENPLPSFMHYTESNCLDQCLSDKSAEICKCVRLDLGYKFSKKTAENTTYCEGERFKCVRDVIANSTKNVWKSCPHCKPGCNEIEYSMQASTLPLPKGFAKRLAKGIEQQGENSEIYEDEVKIDEDATIVHIYMGTDNVYSKVRKNIYGFTEMFAQIGGILGLFLGLSVISLIEPLNIWVRKLFTAQTAKTLESTQMNKDVNTNATVNGPKTDISLLYPPHQFTTNGLDSQKFYQNSYGTESFGRRRR